MNIAKLTDVLMKGSNATEWPPVVGRAATEALVSSIVSLITAVCEASMPQKKPSHRRRPANWRSQETANLRKDTSCYAGKRNVPEPKQPKILRTQKHEEDTPTSHRPVITSTDRC